MTTPEILKAMNEINPLFHFNNIGSSESKSVYYHSFWNGLRTCINTTGQYQRGSQIQAGLPGRQVKQKHNLAVRYEN